MQWCGQSHSGQIPCGLPIVESLFPQFDVTIQEMVLPVTSALDVYIGTQGFDSPGSCCTSIMPHAYWESYNGSGVGGGIPPGEVGGSEWTDDLLTYNPTINVSAFMWCWQLEQKNSAYVSAYLAQMELFES